MPKIKPRRGRFQIGNALAAGITGYTQGKERGAAEARKQGEYEAKLAKYQEAQKLSDRDTAQKEAQRTFLSDEARKSNVKRQRKTRSMIEGGGGQTPEQTKYFTTRINELGKSGRSMLKIGIPIDEVNSFMEEGSNGLRQEIMATEAKNIEGRLYEIENDEKLQSDPKFVKMIRDLIEEGETAPNEINKLLDRYDTGRNATVQRQDTKRIGDQRAAVVLSELEADPNMTWEQYEAARQIYLRIEQDGYRRANPDQMVKAMKKAAEKLAKPEEKGFFDTALDWLGLGDEEQATPQRAQGLSGMAGIPGSDGGATLPSQGNNRNQDLLDARP